MVKKQIGGRRMITGELSADVNRVIKEFAKHYADNEIAAAINAHPEFSKNGRIAKTSVTQRRSSLGIVRGRNPIKSEDRPPLVVTIGGVAVTTEAGGSGIADKRESRSLKSFSEISGLRAYLAGRIDSGALTSPDCGIAALFADAGERYSGSMRKERLTLTADSFVKLIKELVWSKKMHDLLKEHLLPRVPAEWDAAIGEWQRIHAHIPLDWVTERSKWIRGVSSKTPTVIMVPGMGGNLEEGWLSQIPNIEIPASSHDHPYRIAVPTKEPKWTVLNGANLGLLYDRDIEFNPLRRKLAEAHLHGVDVVVLTNVFALQIIKAAGALMVLRAKLAGLNINKEILDEDYQEEARWILEEQPDDEVVFETPIERAANVFSGLYKIQTRPDNSLEFPGKVVMVLGYLDELLIATLTYDALNYLRIRKQSILRQEIRAKERERDNALRKGDAAAYRDAEDAINVLEKQHTRSTTTGIAAQEIKRFEPKLRSLFLKMLWELVPNVEVVGMGSAHLCINDKPSIAIHIPSHIRVTENLLGDFVSRKAGPKILRKNIAQTTVICHPFALQSRDTVREADHDGRRDSVQIFVAPTLIDDDYIRKAIKNTVRIVHPLQQAVLNDQYKPGALVFRYHGGIVAHDFWPLTRPLPIVRLKKKGNGGAPERYPDFGSARYMWYMVDTDKHVGSRSKDYLWVEKPHRRRLGLAEAVMHSMRVSGYLGSPQFGIHFMSMNDDITQGNHFEGHFQPDPQQMSRTNIEDMSHILYRKAKKANSAGRLRLFSAYQQFMLKHQDVLGLDHPTLQVEEVVDRFIHPNMDFYSAVLRRAKESGIIVKPVSEHYGVPFDQRDLGIINWGTGNHFERTVDRRLTESFFYARIMREKLLQEEYWKTQEEYVRKFVAYPMYSNFFCAWGTIGVNGGYEWGMDLRDSPTRMKNWGDPVAGAIANDLLRGNPTRIMEGRYCITTYGDKHFYGTGITAQKLYHMCAPGVHTDRYGEHGFPPNNSGVSFLGIPVDGPQLPFLFRYLRYDQILLIALAGFVFDWERFLPNPV